jgi:adenylate cyclase
VVGLGLALAWMLVLAFGYGRTSLDNGINDALMELRLALLGPSAMRPEIAIIDLSDTDVERLAMKVGERRDFARLVRVLDRARAASVIFDLAFSQRGSPEEDNSFALASGAYGATIQATILTKAAPDGAERPAPDPLRDWTWHPRVVRDGDPPEYARAISSYPELLDTARSLGAINAQADKDGIYRRMPLLFRHGDGFLPSLALAAACDMLQVAPKDIEVDFGRSLRLPDARLADGNRGDIAIPIDEQGRILLNLPGTWGSSFPHYSFSRLLDAETDEALAEEFASELEGRSLILADLSTSTSDYGPVAFERDYPLAGLHATIINSIVTDNFLREPTWLEALAAVVSLGLALCLVLWRLPQLWGSLAAAVIWFAFCAAEIGLFFSLGLMPTLAAPSLALVFILIGHNMLRFIQAEQDKIRLRGQVSRYFSPEVLANILRRSGMERLAAKRKTITVLFSDIAGFTAWCSTRDPETVHRVLGEYFQDMTAIVFRHQGTVDKFIGDGLMAFFGDPQDHPDHAKRAVAAALEMQETVQRLRKQWEPQGIIDLHIRVGINTGEAVVGDLGSTDIMAYTAIGAQVNLASRLESLCPVDGILVSGAVAARVGKDFHVREAGMTSAKGISDPFPTFLIVPETPDDWRQMR